jgi:peptide deformylase
MILPLAYYGDAVLRKKAAPIAEITDEIRQLVKDMAETMDANNGCGIAAPQVHKSIALFLTCMPKIISKDQYEPGELKVYINPKIISYSDEVIEDWHGCLSIPGLESEGILRPMRVKVQATDLNGKVFEEECVGPDAIAICHENDHLNGVLFIDRCSAKYKKMIDPKLREIKKKFSGKYQPM